MLKTMGMWTRASGIEATGESYKENNNNNNHNNDDDGPDEKRTMLPSDTIYTNTNFTNHQTTINNFNGGGTADMDSVISSRGHGTTVAGYSQKTSKENPMQDVPVALTEAAVNKEAQKTTTTTTPSSDDTTTMIMVVVLFLSCNTLALVVNIVETFFEISPLTINYMTDTSNFLVILNSSVNFVIYLIFSKDFRWIFQQVYFGCCCLLFIKTDTNNVNNNVNNNNNNNNNNNHEIGTTTDDGVVIVKKVSGCGRICGRMFNCCCCLPPPPPSSSSVSSLAIRGGGEPVDSNIMKTHPITTHPVLPANNNNNTIGNTPKYRYPIALGSNAVSRKSIGGAVYALVPHTDNNNTTTSIVSMPPTHAGNLLQNSSFQTGRLASQ